MRQQTYPIFVLDGPDATGKSTLANQFKTVFNAKVLHCTYRWPSKMPEYHLAVFDLALRLSQERPVVIDRWWPSQEVYAEVFRSGNPWPYYPLMLDRIALRHSAHYVFCLPKDKQRYLAHFEEVKGARKEMFDKMDRVYDGFTALAGCYSGHPNVSYHDLFDPDEQLVGDYYFKALEDLALTPRFIRNIDDKRVAGSLRSRVVLCGDRSNKHTRRDTYPFVAGHGCSPWFTQHLAGMGAHEHDLLWLNLHDQDGKLQWTTKELETFKDKVFVGLGSLAQRTLEELGLPFKRLPHPQWLKRFHHNKPPYPTIVSLFKELEVLHDY